MLVEARRQVRWTSMHFPQNSFADLDFGVVTWRVSEPTTTVIPKSTPAKDGQPGTTYFVATSTFEYNGVK